MTSEETIRDVLSQHAKLGVDATTIGADDDLYAAGMTSHASVNVMLALEDAFDIEFPEELLRRQTFASVSAIREAVEGLAQ
ncbi:MAG: acyl carrier protein [Micrococcales bacterium]|nr:acyl carrier protein [Micrococcales bacterium]